MAYDGGILIDHQFRTKDPSIYAAGPVTRYCRKHYADTKQQKYFDAFEVGTKVSIKRQDDDEKVKKSCSCVAAKTMCLKLVNNNNVLIR